MSRSALRRVFRVRIYRPNLRIPSRQFSISRCLRSARFQRVPMNTAELRKISLIKDPSEEETLESIHHRANRLLKCVQGLEKLNNRTRLTLTGFRDASSVRIQNHIEWLYTAGLGKEKRLATERVVYALSVNESTIMIQFISERDKMEFLANEDRLASLSPSLYSDGIAIVQSSFDEYKQHRKKTHAEESLEELDENAEDNFRVDEWTESPTMKDSHENRSHRVKKKISELFDRLSKQILNTRRTAVRVLNVSEAVESYKMDPHAFLRKVLLQICGSPPEILREVSAASFITTSDTDPYFRIEFLRLWPKLNVMRRFRETQPFLPDNSWDVEPLVMADDYREYMNVQRAQQAVDLREEEGKDEIEILELRLNRLESKLRHVSHFVFGKWLVISKLTEEDVQDLVTGDEPDAISVAEKILEKYIFQRKITEEQVMITSCQLLPDPKGLLIGFRRISDALNVGRIAYQRGLKEMDAIPRIYTPHSPYYKMVRRRAQEVRSALLETHADVVQITNHERVPFFSVDRGPFMPFIFFPIQPKSIEP